ncbi:MAG: PSP1 domain-containing protein [Planctomycetota bacterium]
MKNVEFFSGDEDCDLREKEEVIVRTERGVEWGTVLSLRQDVEEDRVSGQILRKATQQDKGKLREIRESKEPEEYQVCEELIDKYELPMKLVKVEHIFGGHKIIFFFTADGRVDFRDLVKELAGRYRTRIEMRQIGVRDEARLLGLFGSCGRELCCCKFLQALKPVPMKVAKNQKSTLDPAKIGGRCGRLKCCLKYETKLYEELKENLPRRGADVTTDKGECVVIGYEILSQTVRVRYPDDTEETCLLDEISSSNPSG